MKEFFAKLGAAVKAHKGRTVAVSVVAFVLICAVVTLSCLGAFVFNRFSEGYVPTEEQLAAAQGQYERVLIIGVDGMGDYVKRMDDGSMPNFDKLFNTKDGLDVGDVHLNASVTHTGMAVYPTISAQNWTSMFHGVRPIYHGITGSNSNKDLDAGKQADGKYPSFVKAVLDAYPNAKAISSCTWSAVNNGAIEDIARVKKINNNCNTIYAIANGNRDENGDPIIKDDEQHPEGKALVDRIVAVTDVDGYADETYALTDSVTVRRLLDETEDEDYLIAYMHLNQVDSAGHSYGNNKHAYIKAVAHVDVIIGELFEAYEARGWLDSTLFILCTDHGHRYLQDGTGHGGNSSVERTVTFAIAGKTVKSGTPGKYVNTDLAPIVTYALGVKAPESWQGRVPYNMFTPLG